MANLRCGTLLMRSDKSIYYHSDSLWIYLVVANISKSINSDNVLALGMKDGVDGLE